MTRIVRPILLSFLILFNAQSAGAYFERVFVSTRASSIGGAFTGVADGPIASVVNPAGLTQLRSPAFTSSFVQPYGIPNLEEHQLAIGFPTRFGAFGVSWHRFALRDVTSEDLVTIAYGRDYIRNSQDASLSFGGSLDIARVQVGDAFDLSKTVVTGSFSILLRPFPVIGFGYNLRNLGQPSFDLISGGGKTNLRTTQAFGVAYHWQRRSVFLYEIERGQDGSWQQHVGVEVNATKPLRFRAGLSAGDVSGGVGLTMSRVTVDIGASSHNDLGVSYLISVGFRLPYAGEDEEIDW